jgi:quercetin dioxygenase-like cupin family protein
LFQLPQPLSQLHYGVQLHRVQAGEMILMPAKQPHALKALQRYKMILTMIRS